MPTLNEADDRYQLDNDDILGINNLQLTPEECKEVIDHFADFSGLPESVQKLAQLIETAYNLGMAHVDDTKETVDIIIAADYCPVDIDGVEDTNPHTDTPSESTSHDIEKDAN